MTEQNKLKVINLSVSLFVSKYDFFSHIVFQFLLFLLEIGNYTHLSPVMQSGHSPTGKSVCFSVPDISTRWTTEQILPCVDIKLNQSWLQLTLYWPLSLYLPLFGHFGHNPYHQTEFQVAVQSSTRREGKKLVNYVKL